jgi:hypothetical protein
MEKSRDGDHRAGVVIGCAALLIGVMAIVAIANGPAGFQVANNDPATAGASGLARPHEPLDRAPGDPLDVPLLGERRPGAQVRLSVGRK